MDLNYTAGVTARTDLDAGDTYQGPTVLVESGRTWTAATHFRARFITESLKLGPRDTWEYEVKVSGPVQTKTGRDHAGQSDERRYTDPQGRRLYGSELSLDQLPELLRPYLHGREALAAEFRAVVSDAA